MARQVERHAYGAEGHREPERGWSMDDTEDSDVNSLLENESGDDTAEAAARRRAELGRLIDAVRRVAGSAGFEQYPGPPPRRADAGLRARGGGATEDIVREMRGLRQDLRGLSGAVRAGAARPAPRPAVSSSQQLAASAAEVRALERTDRGLEADDAAQKRRLARLESAIRALRRRRAAPVPAAAPAPAAPLARRRRMSDLEAARDLSDYFDRLGAQTAADTAAHVQAELAQLQAVGVGGGGAAATAAAPQATAAAAAVARQQSLAELIKSL
jgi:hypothetical protein